MTFEFYGNEEVKTIDEIEEVDVIEGEDGDENPYNHYERTRHLFDAPERTKKDSSKQKEYVNLISLTVELLMSKDMFFYQPF